MCHASGDWINVGDRLLISRSGYAAAFHAYSWCSPPSIEREITGVFASMDLTFVLSRRSPFCVSSGIPGCHSPKFCPAAKSTACTISSAHQFAMTVLHVPLLPTVVRANDPLLSFPSDAALGELCTPAATHRAKTQAPQTEGQPPGQTLLGARAPVLVRLEESSHHRHSRNCGALASCRISALLELDLEGEKTGRQKKTVEGNPESDLPDGGRKPNLGCSPHPRRTAHTGLRRIRAKHFPLDEASTQRSRTCPALAGLCSQSSRRDCRHGFLHCPDSHIPAAVLLLYY